MARNDLKKICNIHLDEYGWWQEMIKKNTHNHSRQIRLGARNDFKNSQHKIRLEAKKQNKKNIPLDRLDG